MATAFTIPGGQQKGTPIDEADDRSLNYWVDRISKSLAEEPGGRFADRDTQWLEAARAELARRAAGGAPAAALRQALLG